MVTENAGVLSNGSAISRFVTLDGLRGIAALCVMSMHLTTPTSISFPDNAFLAVDLFFMLSGFVLSHAYGSRILSGRMPFGQFMLRRAIRLYPAFLLAIVFGTAIMLAVKGHSSSTYSTASIFTSGIVNTLFLPYLNRDTLEIVGLKIPGLVFPANIAGWSLFFEMVGSAAFWGFVRLRPWALVAVSILSLFCLVLYGAWPLSQGIPDHFMDVGLVTANFAGGFFRVGYGMTLGTLLYRLYVKLQQNPKVKLVAQRSSPGSPLLYLAVIAMFTYTSSTHGGVYELFVLVVAGPTIILAGAFMQPLAFFQHVEDWLGWLSYPIYCFHVPIEVFCFDVGLLSRNPWTAVLPGLVIVAAAALLCRYWDEPVRARLGLTLLRSRRPLAEVKFAR